MQVDNLYAVIMAGGSGTRFWPLSRRAHPKQLIRLTGEHTLIQQTVNRLDGFIPPQNIIIVTAEHQVAALYRQLPQIPPKNILKEPAGRNTAACIALAAFYIQNLSPQAAMLVMPADHLIQDTTHFKKVITDAAGLADSSDYLVTLGIKPNCPHTGYGYIIPADKIERTSDLTAYRVKKIAEKPDIKKALKYMEAGALWNSGIFIWRCSVILSALEKYLPDIYRKLNDIAHLLGTYEQKTALASVYPELESISIDYGIMEKYPEVAVIGADFGWNDVGSWTSLREVFPKDKDGNICLGDTVGLDSRDLIIHAPGKLVATIGLKDIIIVDTGDVLLICDAARAQDVKQLLEKVKSEGKKEYL